MWWVEAEGGIDAGVLKKGVVTRQCLGVVSIGFCARRVLAMGKTYQSSSRGRSRPSRGRRWCRWSVEVPFLGCYCRIKRLSLKWLGLRDRLPSLVKLVPAVSTALLPKTISSLSLTSGSKPGGVCADTVPAKRSADATVAGENSMAEGSMSSVDRKWHTG